MPKPDRLDDLEERLSTLEARLKASESQGSAECGPIEPIRLYTMSEVASRLRCGLSSVYQLAEGGDLAVTRLGAKKGLKVTGSDLFAFLESRREGGSKPPDVMTRLKAYIR